VQRSADQAEREAQSLQAQAQSARTAASRAQGEARNLETQSNQADIRAGRARQNVEVIRSESQQKNQLSSSFDSSSQSQQTQTSPVVNTQGQLTGKLINATA
jgi:hypothetical protein